MVFPDISMYLNDENIMKDLILERYRLTPRQELIIKDFMRSLNELRRHPINGGAIVTNLEIRNFINEVWINKLIRIGAIKKAIRTMRGRSNSVTSLMKAIQWVDIMNRQEENVQKKVAYCQYKAKKEDTADLFAHLNKTWKDIQPEEKNGELVLEIKDSYNISNGERDTLLFIGNLEAVKYAMGNKDTILIIDEVFDYMDDANIVAAQYYIQRFLDRMKGHAYLFPIILTHNDPEKFFRYNHQKDLKISYFDHPACEVPNEKIKKMINKRQIWLEDEKLPSDLKDALDDTNKYLFHFHPNVDDKTEIPEMKGFSKVKDFKDFCKTQLDNYLKNQMNRNKQKPAYDPLAICFALREMVEKYLYDRLQTDEQKKKFLNETEGTHDKIRIAQEANVKPIPLIFEFLSMIYNEPLHVKDEVNKKLTDAHKRLFSRLHNRTIQLMIKEVKDLSDAPIDEN
jgi:hypothetical protein